MDEVAIRRAERERDVVGLSALLAALGYPAGANEVVARLAWTETSPTDEVLLAELAQFDGPVGLVTLHLVPRFAEGGWVGQLTAVVVAERARRRGVGRRLVGAAERQAVGAGCAFVEVSAGRRPERSAAHDFYLALG